jgi:DNA helicase-2/ATP-dependent DNA helicase PcrA
MARIDILDGLNPAQRQAAEHVEGPLLIVAGPGSGKTRVIVHRIAYLVKVVDIPPYRICAVTFTNRAAREMRERLTGLLGTRAENLTTGTFHAFCASILRRDGEKIGVGRNFTIYDDEDQRALLKEAVHDAKVDDRLYSLRGLQSAISNAKSQLLSPEAFRSHSGSYKDEIVFRAYSSFQELLRKNNAVDFDDLLMQVVELFRRVPETLHKYQDRYQHLLVDEFQDTNFAQSQIASMLSGKYRNICVVGDPDQSIYSWRNADVRNILSFANDYPDATVVNLEQNYRSTQTILEAANGIVSGNRSRLDKTLWTGNPEGVPVIVGKAFTGQEEAQMVIQEVEWLCNVEGHRLRDCAVMYRVNAQSRVFEEACRSKGVSYILVGGVKFFQRREVKDVLAYMRLIHNHYDEVGILRVINIPPRGIGKRTIEVVRTWAASQDIPLFDALQVIANKKEKDEPLDIPITPRSAAALANFSTLVSGLREVIMDGDVVKLMDAVLERTEYWKWLESTEDRVEERWENIQELRGMAREYDAMPPAEGLQSLLESAALMTDLDALDEDEQQDYLTLITLHQAKGLEYPVVFIVGLEDGLLPHSRSIKKPSSDEDDPTQLEEERRLLYVGITRAKERLYLTLAFKRSLHGITQDTYPSRFLADIPKKLKKCGFSFGRQSEAASSVSHNYEKWPYNSTVRRGAKVEATSTEVSFRDGDRVRHATFGDGVVVSIKPSGYDYEVAVAFKGEAGLKRLMLSLAPLDKV